MKNISKNAIISSLILLIVTFQIKAQTLEQLPLQIPNNSSKSEKMTGYNISQMNIPIQLSLAPGMTTNPNYLFINNNLSLNLTLGDGYMLNGFQFSIISNRLQQELKGVQLSMISNYTGGSVTGIQSSLFYNESSLSVNGVQFSGMVNYTFNLNGIQIGLVNFHETGNGIQAGILNSNKYSSEGTQIGLMNLGSESIKNQSGIINIADSTFGSQIGLINKAEYSEGFQIGIVNISENNQGYSVGMINILKNGRNNFEINMNESNVQFIQYRTGSQRFQFVYHIGFKPMDPQTPFLTGLGFSLKKPLDFVSIGYDLMVDKVSYNKIWDSNLSFLIRNQFVIEGEVTSWFRIMAGISLNAYGSELKNGYQIVNGKDHFDPVNNAWYRVGLGYTAGISLF